MQTLRVNEREMTDQVKRLRVGTGGDGDGGEEEEEVEERDGVLDVSRGQNLSAEDHALEGRKAAVAMAQRGRDDIMF